MINDKVNGERLVSEFKQFKEHVDNEMYPDVEQVRAKREKGLEKGWPLYEDSAHLLLQASPSRNANHVLSETLGNLDQVKANLEYVRSEGAAWKVGFHTHIQWTMMMLQNHIHPEEYSDEQGNPKPPPWCQTKRNPGECRSGFPFNGAMCEEWMTKESLENISLLTQPQTVFAMLGLGGWGLG